MEPRRHDAYTWEERQYKDYGPYDALVDQQGQVRAAVMPTYCLRDTTHDLAAVVLYGKDGKELDCRIHIEHEEAVYIAEAFVEKRHTSSSPWRSATRPSPEDLEDYRSKHTMGNEKTRGDEGIER
jgi:hypothetical protein